MASGFFKGNDVEGLSHISSINGTGLHPKLFGGFVRAVSFFTSGSPSSFSNVGHRSAVAGQEQECRLAGAPV